VAAAAFGAGVEVQKIFVREVGEFGKADFVLIDIRRRQATLGVRIDRHQRAHGGEDVLHLGVWNEADEGEREKTMGPPEPHAETRTAFGADADPLQDRGGHGADRRPPPVIPDRRFALQPDQPGSLQQKAGRGDQDKGPQERPVLAAIGRAIVVGLVERAIGAAVIQFRKRQPLAPVHHIKKASDQPGAGNVQNLSPVNGSRMS